MTDQPGPDQQPASPEDELEQTAEAWRSGSEGTEVEESADEVARGAERAAEQPDYGREGS